MAQTIIFDGNGRSFSVELTALPADTIALRTADERATVESQEEAGDWIASRVLTALGTVRRVMIRQPDAEVVGPRELSRYGAPIMYAPRP